MGLFDKLKKASDGFFDGLKNNAVDNALSNAREERLKKEANDKLEDKRREKEQLDKILANIPKTLPPTTKEELIEIRIRRELEEKEKNERNERIKQIEKEHREKLKNSFINKYGEEIGKRIYKKELFVGMTLEMLKDVKGKHSEKVENVTNGKIKVKLFYEKSKNRLGNVAFGFEVSLENGLVVGWKDRKNKGTIEG